MILEVAVLDVRPGQSERFLSAFEKAQTILMAATGYHRHELQRSGDRENRYLLLVWWDSIESHTVGFRGSAPYQEWKKLLHRFYDPFPQVEHYLQVPTLSVTKTPQLWIMVSGPYRTGSHDLTVWSKNLQQLNVAALAVFQKGHIPVLGVNMALPLITQAGSNSYNSIMMPLSLKLAERCDAVLRIGGASDGADEEVAAFRKSGRPVFTSLDEIPSVS
jgi:heme-degrading monooxygenase HmoA